MKSPGSPGDFFYACLLAAPFRQRHSVRGNKKLFLTLHQIELNYAEVNDRIWKNGAGPGR